MSPQPLSQRIFSTLPWLLLVGVFFVLVAVKLGRARGVDADDVALVIGTLIVAGLAVTRLLGARPTRRTTGLTETFQSPHEASETRRFQRLRRWLEAHPTIDRLRRVAAYGCFGLAVVGFILAWRSGPPYVFWPHLANLCAVVLSGLGGGESQAVRGSSGRPDSV
jgi:hypothetical protein